MASRTAQEHSSADTQHLTAVLQRTAPMPWAVRQKSYSLWPRLP